MKTLKHEKAKIMKKWITMAIIFAAAILGLMLFEQLRAPQEKPETQKHEITALCANFTDASSCDSAVRKWERKKGGIAFAAVDYQPDSKSSFKEGWVIYLLLSRPVQVPETNRTAFRIGVLADKSSNDSVLYEYVK